MIDFFFNAFILHALHLWLIIASILSSGILVLSESPRTSVLASDMGGIRCKASQEYGHVDSWKG